MNPVFYESDDYPGTGWSGVPLPQAEDRLLEFFGVGDLDASLDDHRDPQNPLDDLTVCHESCLTANVALPTTNETSNLKEYGGVADTEGRDVSEIRPEDATSVNSSSNGYPKEWKDEGMIDKMAKLSTPPHRRQRKRLSLPLVVSTRRTFSSIIACPDSGSDDNIMSLKTAHELGLPIMDIRDPTPPAFVMANGRTVSAVGRVVLLCAFMQGVSCGAFFECVCYVFHRLAVPMIMGLEFLHSTETLSKYRDRLTEEFVPMMRSLRVCSVGRPKRQIVCRVGHYVGCATADTGSDLDLVSPEFAASRAFHVEDSCVEVEFADGSRGYTTGVIETDFSIGSVGDVEGFIPRTQEMVLELFVLDSLNADILISADTIQDLQAFSSHGDCFIPSMPYLGQSDLNIIRYIGAVERGIFRAWEFMKDSFVSSEKKKAATKSMTSRLVSRTRFC